MDRPAWLALGPVAEVGGKPTDHPDPRPRGYMVPEVRYAERSSLSIAYQKWGEGDQAVLLIPDWTVAGEAVWEHPGHIRAWRFYASIGTVLRFDRSGIGASDPVPAESLGSIEDWAADAIAVMDAEGVGTAVVTGESFGAHAAMFLAARFPDRVSKLILTNAYARLTRAADYPIGPPAHFVDIAAEFIHDAWGTGAVIGGVTKTLSMGGDYQAFCGRFERIAASRATATAMVRAMYTSDVRFLLDTIRTPTLVTYTGDHEHVERAHSEYLAEHLPNAHFEVWRSGSFYGSEERRQGYQQFLQPEADRSRARKHRAVFFTDIVNSTVEAQERGDLRWRELLEDVDDLTAREVDRAGGRIVTRTGDGALAEFPAPLEAVQAALRVVKDARVLGLTIRCGVHVGEVERRSDGDLAGVTVHLAARVASAANGGEVLVSSDAAAELDPAIVKVVDQGGYELKGFSGTWQLYAVTE